MAVFVSHESALRYWLTKTGDECVPEVAPVCSLAWANASMKEIKGLPLPMDFSEDRPLDVLVPDQASLRSLVAVKTHLWGGALPVGSFRELSGSSYVSSPEFTFLQVAARRNFVETLEIGYHLCGAFSIDGEGHGYAGQRAPLTTPESIASFLAQARGAYGARKARGALRYLRPNVASAMEILLAMAFSLPPGRGGWAFPEITANQRINVDEHLRKVADASYFVGDIYLPSVRGDVEFDSKKFHTGRWRADHTQARRNVLEVMGVKTMSATWSQIDDFDKFETFVWMVKERFGIPHRAFTRAETTAQIELYEHLTDFGRTLF